MKGDDKRRAAPAIAPVNNAKSSPLLAIVPSSFLWLLLSATIFGRALATPRSPPRLTIAALCLSDRRDIHSNRSRTARNVLRRDALLFFGDSELSLPPYEGPKVGRCFLLVCPRFRSHGQHLGATHRRSCDLGFRWMGRY